MRACFRVWLKEVKKSQAFLQRRFSAGFDKTVNTLNTLHLPTFEAYMRQKYLLRCWLAKRSKAERCLLLRARGGVAFLSRSNNGQRDVQDDTETRATREALGDDDDDVASDFGFGFDGV